MRLKSFQVLDYRSINDSGWVEVSDRTVLVGRNESGKTNLLLALQSLNPPGGPQPLSYVKDFPRHRHHVEFDENHTLLKTVWQLSESESGELAGIFPRAQGVRELTISRAYKPARQLRFHGLPPLAVNQETVEKQIRSFERAIKNQLKECEAGITEKASRALTIAVHEMSTGLQDPTEWARRQLKVIPVFRQSHAGLKLELPDNAATQLENIERHANELAQDREQYQKAMNWVMERLPVFVYLSEYPRINGHQNLKSLAQRLEKKQLEEEDQNFLRLCKAAELDPLQLTRLLTIEHQQRQVLTNRAGAVVTKKLRELWSDRPLKVRFHLDADHFDTLVSEPGDVYDVEVNLDERSRGFKWFFSFYINFAAGGESARETILLLDEPGMYLHPHAQQDLLKHFMRDFEQAILYTTHSPFMIPATDLSAVRTVNLDPEAGTWVANQPRGDAKTLFPLRAALGYRLGEALVQGGVGLVVENLADFWYLSAALAYLRAQYPDLPALDIAPTGGGHTLACLAALLDEQQPRPLVLSDRVGEVETSAELAGRHLLRLAELLPEESPASIEDLLDADVLGRLIQQTHPGNSEAFSQVETGRNALDAWQRALQSRGNRLDRGRVARAFAQGLATRPGEMLSPAASERFLRLFREIGNRTQPVPA